MDYRYIPNTKNTSDQSVYSICVYAPPACINPPLPQIRQAPRAVDPDEGLRTIMRIWGIKDLSNLATAFGALPKEVVFQVIYPLLRESWLKQIGAPLRPSGTREYSIADYINDHGQPTIDTMGRINLLTQGLTSLQGVTMIENAENVVILNLSNNYLSNYVQPDLLSMIGDPINNHPFSRFINLKNLELMNNKYYTLPGAFFHGLSSLVLLSLKDNQLTELPPTLFHGLSSLGFLDLRHNYIPGTEEDFIQTHVSTKTIPYFEFYPQNPTNPRGIITQKPQSIRGRHSQDMGYPYWQPY